MHGLIVRLKWALLFKSECLRVRCIQSVPEVAGCRGCYVGQSANLWCCSYSQYLVLMVNSHQRTTVQ